MQEFKQKLIELAKRSIAAAPRCQNEGAVKMFLVLPVIQFLGYNAMDPDEVYPEHHADFSDKYKNRVDYAILRNGEAIIAIECKQVGAPLKDDRGQLRSYFNAARSVKMGVLTDGLKWEFYADSDEANYMDENPFLVLDMRDVAEGKVDDSAVAGLRSLGKTEFDPENIGAEAKRKHVYNSMLQQIAALAAEPSEPFCRMLLQSAGVKHVRQGKLEDFRGLVRSAFQDFISQQILHRLDISKADHVQPAPVSPIVTDAAPSSIKPEERIVTTETELAVYRWVQQRLAFLVDDDALFREIAHVTYRDYQGKFVVYYKKERRGRLFDFVEGRADGAGPRFRFAFPDDVGLAEPHVVTDDLMTIDQALLSTFKARVAALNKAAATPALTPAAV